MYSVVLVPLDGSALAEKALAHAKMVAGGAGAEIVLVRAVVNPLTRMPESGIPEEAAFMESLLDDARVYLERTAAELKAEGMRVRPVVREGEPEDVILSVAGEENADLIIMGTHGRSGISLLVMGSVAEKVMHATGRPVMFVKPEKAAKARAGAGVGAEAH